MYFKYFFWSNAVNLLLILLFLKFMYNSSVNVHSIHVLMNIQEKNFLTRPIIFKKKVLCDVSDKALFVRREKLAAAVGGIYRRWSSVNFADFNSFAHRCPAKIAVKNFPANCVRWWVAVLENVSKNSGEGARKMFKDTSVYSTTSFSHIKLITMHTWN